MCKSYHPESQKQCINRLMMELAFALQEGNPQRAAVLASSVARLVERGEAEVITILTAGRYTLFTNREEAMDEAWKLQESNR